MCFPLLDLSLPLSVVAGLELPHPCFASSPWCICYSVFKNQPNKTHFLGVLLQRVINLPRWLGLCSPSRGGVAAAVLVLQNKTKIIIYFFFARG